MFDKSFTLMISRKIIFIVLAAALLPLGGCYMFKKKNKCVCPSISHSYSPKKHK